MKNIPFEFARSIIPLNWDDINWGCRNSIIEWQDAVIFAIDHLENNTDPSVLELAIIDLRERERIEQIVAELSEFDTKDTEVTIRNWLIILLAWAYHEREKSPDPLGLVEEIYANFNYPSEIANIVRYMPPVDGYDPSKHTHEENERRLMENWRKIVEL